MLKRYIENNNVILNIQVADKNELFQKLSQKALDLGYIYSVEDMVKAVEEKEKLSITELKPYVILPHARGSFVKKLFILIVVAKNGIPYKGAKKNTANIVLFIGIPDGDHDYLKLLAGISRLLSKEDFEKWLLKADVVEDVVYTIRKFAGSHEGDVLQSNKKYLIILSLNMYNDDINIPTLLTEVGIDLPTEIEGKNLGHASFFFPFLTAFGFSGGISKYNHTFFGLTDEKSAAAKLNSLLKAENINLSDNGVGSLVQIEAMEVYGGFADVDF